MTPDSPQPASESAPRPPGKVRTWWHPLLAGLLRWQLGSAYQVSEEVPVGTKPLQIDILLLRREGGELPEAVRRMLAGIADHLNEYTLLELKGPTDTLRAGDFRTLLAYAHLYCAQTAPLMDPARMNLVVLAPRLTKPYRNELRTCGVTAQREAPGTWRLVGPAMYGVWLLETQTLAGGEHSLLTVFSPAMLKQWRPVVRELTAGGYQELVVYMMQQIEQFHSAGEKFAMQHMGTKEMEKLRRELWRAVAKEMAPRELVEELRETLSPEELATALSPEELAAALPPEQRERLRALLQQPPQQ
jgi:hypothetical protein